MENRPSMLAIARLLQKDRKVLDEKAWELDGQFECKSTENLAILVQSAGKQLPQEQIELLGKILTAINVDAGNIDLIDIDNFNGLNLPAFRKAGFERVISFGVKPSDLGLHLLARPYSAINWQGIQLLFADSVDQIAQSTDLKKALWAALKQNFLK